jgi:hypothetical protein
VAWAAVGIHSFNLDKRRPGPPILRKWLVSLPIHFIRLKHSGSIRYTRKKCWLTNDLAGISKKSRNSKVFSDFEPSSIGSHQQVVELQFDRKL